MILFVHRSCSCNRAAANATLAAMTLPDVLPLPLYQSPPRNSHKKGNTWVPFSSSHSSCRDLPGGGEPLLNIVRPETSTAIFDFEFRVKWEAVEVCMDWRVAIVELHQFIGSEPDKI